MNSLETGDALAARGAKAPRVTLDSMKSRIIATRYFTAAQGIEGAGDVIVRPVSGPGAMDVLTLCLLVLDNGWTLLGKSAPASVENFDKEKGRTFAYEDALKQLWPLEGYLLRETLFHTADPVMPEIKSTARQSDTGEVLGEGVAFMRPEEKEPIPFS